MNLSIRLVRPRVVSGHWITSGGKLVAERRSGRGSEVAVIGQPGSAIRYEHVQTVPSALWTVNHNLGVKPAAVTVLSVGGVEVMAGVTHTSLNQLLVDFAGPFTGSVRVL